MPGNGVGDGLELTVALGLREGGEAGGRFWGLGRVSLVTGL